MCQILGFNIILNKMGNQVCCQSKQYKKSFQDTPVSLKSIRDSRHSQQIDVILKNAAVNLNQYSLDSFQKICEIGQGGFAIVYLVELKSNISKNIKIQYAMKQIPKKKIFMRRIAENIKLQKKVLAELRSNFIISLQYAFQDSHNCYMVMEYAQGGDLYSFIYSKKNSSKVKQFKALGQFAVKFIIGCIVLAFEVLHKHQIMYRDLKPQNVLIFSNGYPKLADFGLAKKSTPQEPAKTMAGTKVYFAPQILQQNGYTKSVDFWTLGVLIYELLVYELPFDRRNIMKGKYSKICRLAQENRDWKGQSVSQQGKDLINSLLKVDPNQRLGINGFEQIKKHPFFNELDWQKLSRMEYQSPLKPIVSKYKNSKQQMAKINNIIKQQQSFDKLANFTYTNPLMI